MREVILEPLSRHIETNEHERRRPVFTSLRHFLKTWQHESGETARVMAELADESLGQQVAPGYRTLGELAWHVTTAQREIAAKMGLTYEAPDHSAPRPETAAEIRAAYIEAAAALAAAAESQLTDETMQERFEAYGMQWKKGRMLLVIVFHEIHHRGQMTVLMRQAGLKVPGVYGPSKDDG